LLILKRQAIRFLSFALSLDSTALLVPIDGKIAGAISGAVGAGLLIVGIVIFIFMKRFKKIKKICFSTLFFKICITAQP